MLVIEKAKNGEYTAKYKEKYIHSKYDPIRESQIFIKNNESLLKNRIIVVYGLGLGYHINEICKNINNDNTIIYVFEWNKEILKACRNINKGLFKKTNIKIYTQSSYFYKILSNSLSKVNDIIIHKPCLETIKEDNYNLYKLINNYANNKISIKKYGDLLKENFEENKKLSCESIQAVINNFSNIKKPYLIIASGPSLDKNLKMLNKNREKFVIISVGSALMSIMNRGIRPDIIVIIDGKPAVAKQLNGFENENIPLCFLSTASRWAVFNYNGPKYMFFNSCREDKIIIETGKTVAVAAISIALHCNAKEIVLLGQDLAYLDGKSHTSSYEKMYGCKDKPNINKHCKLVKGINGNMLKTTKGYIYFKEQIEKLISINQKVRFTNCSKGALIKGAHHINFEQYLNKKS